MVRGMGFMPPRRRLPKRNRPSAAPDALESRTLFSTWFVAPYGADANAGSIAQPFATIQQAANVAQPGDTVLIRGGVYRETVIPANSGSAAAPITYEPFGNESVTIDGADPVTGWTSAQGSVYTAAQSWDLGEGNNQVFVDGKMVNEARWPNTSLNVSSPTWGRATSVVMNTLGAKYETSVVTLYNSQLSQPAGTWVGSLAHLAAGQEWVDQVGVVTASAPGWVTVTYQQDTSYQVPRNGNRFYIVGSAQALDSAGEWYRDPASGQLSLWDPASDNPAAHKIEAKARLYAFDLSGLSNIDVKGIRLFACTINTDANSTNLLLDHLTATYVSHSIGSTPDTQEPFLAAYHPHTTGITLNGTGNILENSVIAFSSGDGVFLGGSGNTVQNCIIHDVDYEAGDEAGVTTLGSDESVLYNTIYSCARCGVVSRNTTSSFILHNSIHNVAYQMTDCGGIYTWGTDGQGTEIGFNQVYGIYSGGYGAAGIYLDNASQNYLVDHNVVWNCNYDLHLNPPSANDIIVNNTFAGAAGISIAATAGSDMTGCVFENNIFTRAITIGVGTTTSNNLLMTTPAVFINAAACNFQLQAASPAIDAGAIASPYTDNYVGVAPDEGAYEFGQTPFTAGAAIAPLVPPPVPPPALATDYFLPQHYSSAQSISFSGDGVVFSHLQSWLGFKNIDFGAGASQIVAQASQLPAAGISLQVHLDRWNGPRIATLALGPAAAGSAATAQTYTASLSAVTGVHAVYLVLVGVPSGGELDGFTFF